MTLLHVDGFDHYTTLAVARTKYTSITGSSASFGSSSARTGSGGHSGGTGNTIFQVKTADEHATFIVGCAFRKISSSAITLLILHSDSFQTDHVRVMVDVTGKLVVRRGSSSGTILGSEAGNSFSSPAIWHYVEIKATLHDSAGVIELRLDGDSVSPLINLTGQDTKNGGTKTVFDSVSLFDGSSALGFDADDYYICNGAGSANNDFLGDCKVDTLYPSGNGNSSQLVGSDSNSTDNYLLVDEATPNTSDYVGSSTLNEKDTYAFANTTVPGTVKGVQAMIYAQKSDAGSRKVAPVVRHSGTDYDGTDIPVGQGFGYYKQVYEQNPGTAAAWTTANIDSAEFGAKVR